MNKHFPINFIFDSLEQAENYLDRSNKQDFFFFKIKNEEGIYFGDNISNEITQIPTTQGPEIVELGTITWEDINNSPADAQITFPLDTNDFPANRILVDLVTVTEDFDAPTTAPIIDFNSNQIYLSNGFDRRQWVPYKYAVENILIKDNAGQLASEFEFNIESEPIHLNVVLSFAGGAINPKDFTRGSVTFFVYVKQLPNI